MVLESFDTLHSDQVLYTCLIIKMRDNTRVLVVANQKGGVGKTTTALNVAHGLAEFGSRVLLVDMDPQASLTAALGFHLHGLKTTIYDLLVDHEHKLAPADVVQKTSYPHVDLLPANILLANAEKQLVTQLNRERRLATILKDLTGYDAIIVDCPPSLGILTTNALAAADEVLIPIETDYLAFLALEPLRATLKEIEHEINPRLSRFWILPTKHHKRTEHSRSILDEIRTAFPGHVLDAVVPYSVRAKDSVARAESIFTSDPHHPVAEAYRALVQEIRSHA